MKRGKRRDAPVISVIMAVHNEEMFVCEALESILNQTYADFEFLIADDASDDKSLKLIKKYAKKDKRIRIFTNKRREGLTKNLNKLIARASGKYIARMDADDVSLPERFEREIEFLDKNPHITMVGSNHVWIDESGKAFKKSSHLTNPEAIAQGMYGVNQFCHSSVMLRARDLISAGMYDTRYRHAQDFELWLRLLSRGFRLANLSQTLQKLRFVKRKQPRSYWVDNKDLLGITIMLHYPRFFIHPRYCLTFVQRMINLLVLNPLRRVIKSILIKA